MIVNYFKIYEQLGYLFYALASADKKLRRKEYEVLKQDIEREWIPLENTTDEFGTDAANYIYFTYDRLVDQDLSPMEAFESFKTYFEDHSSAFDESVRSRIKTTAEHMAKAARTKNKIEVLILKQLRKLLKSKELVH